MHVPERLVAGGQRHDIGGGIDPLDVRTGRYPRHDAVQAKAPSQLTVHLASALTRHEQAYAPVSERGHGLHQGSEPLALEARSDERDQPRFPRDPERLAHFSSPAQAIVGMEAGKVHSVVDRGDALGRRVVETLDLGLAPLGDRHDVARGLESEDPTFQPQKKPMLRIYLKSAPSRGLEIRPVTAFSRANRSSCRQGEAELAEHRGLARHGQSAEASPRHRKLPGRRDEVDVVAAARDEGVEEASRGRLDTAVEGKGTTDDGEPHALARCFAITRSISGKRSRRADWKL